MSTKGVYGQGSMIALRIRFGLLVFAVWLLWLGLPTQPGWAGEYFSEEVTSPSIEIIHGWKEKATGLDIAITSSSRGTLRIPMEIKAKDCGLVEMNLSSGRTVPVGKMEQCAINLFPFADKLINQEVAKFRVAIAERSLEIPLTDNDRLVLARVGNQSRQEFIFFQKELSRIVEICRPNPTLAPTTPQTTFTPISPPISSVVSPLPAATPPPSSLITPPPIPATTPPDPSATSAPTGSVSDALILIGRIQETRVGAGSQLKVEAINRSQTTVLAAQARFDFYLANQLVDTRTTAFTPSDVPPGEKATAQVVKTDTNWDRVTVSFRSQNSAP